METPIRNNGLARDLARMVKFGAEEHKKAEGLGDRVESLSRAFQEATGRDTDPPTGSHQRGEGFEPPSVQLLAPYYAQPSQIVNNGEDLYRLCQRPIKQPRSKDIRTENVSW